MANLSNVFGARRGSPRAVLVACFCGIAAANGLAHVAGQDPPKPWDASRMAGGPEPEPPFVVERVFPKLPLDWPICLRRVPGRPFYLAIEEDGPYARAHLTWFRDAADADQANRLLSFDNVAYDIAFHPDFASNGYVYIGSAEPKHPAGPRCVVARYTLRCGDDLRLVEGSRKDIIAWNSNGHNGAAVAFGLDGLLYVTTGDGTVRRDLDEVGQRLDTLRAKVLRIDVDRPEGERSYSIPPDNPFIDLPGACPETWCYGFRNPWRIAVDSETGQVWVGNNGQDAWEQVYRLAKGANYGWSIVEGSHPFIRERERGPHRIALPAFEHPHSEARSLTGGQVYRGEQHPTLYGAYVYGDYATGKIWAGRHDGARVVSHGEIADTALSITCFTKDAHGELLIADHRGSGEGGFYRLRANPNAGNKTDFPDRLSETGLFDNTATLEPAVGVVPYAARTPAWHDGATSRRWLALPADSGDPARPAPIKHRARGGWDLPDGSALVQQLTLSLGDQRNVRLETRILLRRQGEWRGYTYCWNRDQTDATLAPAGGAVVDLAKRTGDATRGDEHHTTWRAPSRSQCMACHSRAANYLLSLTADQISVAQQRLWSDVGLLRGGPKTLPSDSEVDERSPEAAARRYLHVNCAHCHVADGGGNARIVLDQRTPLEKTGLLGVAPLHGGMGLRSAALAAPGAPHRSVLAFRMATLGGGRMPRVGSHRVDAGGLRLVRDWITTLAPDVQSPSDAELREALERLARGEGDASDALLLAFAHDDQRLAAPAFQKLKETAGSHPEPLVRAALERLLPEQLRAKRLGPEPDLEAVLALRGNPARGRRLFHQSGSLACRQCHRVVNEGRRVGPDLDAIGDKYRDSRSMLTQLASPSQKIDPKYATWLVQLEDGRVLTGLAGENDPMKNLTLTMADGSVKSLQRNEVVAMRRQTVSLMPDDLLRRLTAQQAADLVAYLMQLRGP